MKNTSRIKTLAAKEQSHNIMDALRLMALAYVKEYEATHMYPLFFGCVAQP